MTFGDQSHNLGYVQRAAGAVEYVVYHINLRHTLDLFRSARRSFLLRGPAQAAERIHLSLGNSFKDVDEVIAKVVWHGSSPLELRGEHTKCIAYVNMKLHTYAKRDKLEGRQLAAALVRMEMFGRCQDVPQSGLQSEVRGDFFRRYRQEIVS